MQIEKSAFLYSVSLGDIAWSNSLCSSISSTSSPKQLQSSRPPLLSPSELSSKTIKNRGSSDVIVVSSDDEDDVIVPPKRRRSSKQTEVVSGWTKLSSSDPIQAPAIRDASPRVDVAVSLGSADSARKQFLENLKTLHGPVVSVVNQVDNTSPPLTFKFVNESILGSGVEAATTEVMIGCECRKDNGRNIGCEYLSCGCLADSALNSEGKKVFPYSAAKINPGCLRDFYLESRHHIYECNAHCNCEENCKNRKVQHGRQVPLEIFKTEDRGWVHLRKGEFIDTYRGEIITADEATKRGNERTQDEGNYLMDFDKFTEPQAITKTEFLETFPGHIRWHEKKVKEEDWTVYTKNGEKMWLNPEHVANKYVCDGMHVGGPTRFMNHSCDPNCRLFTASYNHSDPNLYDLAFFALEEIPAGTELTFDYKDEDDRSVITDEQALGVKARTGYMPHPCLCKADNCRRYFFN
ncbi:MAG: hypothetical protein Q9203_007468 [Teloschistes exilis]